MPEKTKQNDSSEPGSYYYDDATGYEPFDPDAPDEDDEENCSDGTDNSFLHNKLEED
ncbi:MAG TPA: hypothetical protein PKM58_05880 [Pyrinomonadaceae bacterium]|nr:hypothetical protein [Pyrinomonadaceae bacterium]HNU09471.1 hypothetical protein [Pyrinomonadaceae bacterium]